jgi:hypothetical protein
MRESKATFAWHEYGEEPEMVGAILLLIFLAVGLALYFLPALIAGSRHHPNATAIFVLNLLLGWTFIGWVVSLVWSFSRPAAPLLYAPAYPPMIAVPQNAAIETRNPSILPPASQYRGAR